MSFTLKRGLSNVYVAEVEKDDNETTGGYKTGTPFHLMPAGEMSRSVASDKTVVYFDNVAFYTSGAEGATDINVSGAAIRPNDLAKLLGKNIDDATGAVLDTGEFVEKYWALGAETENTDGTKEMFWFLKGTFSAPEQNDKTKDDSTDTNGMELTYSAVQTTHLFDVGNEKKPMKRVVIDTETTVLKADGSWTKQVVTPDNLSEVVSKKTV